ncbi:MAG: acyltransferase domain-containing protein [Ruthenibacterium sp.]
MLYNSAGVKKALAGWAYDPDAVQVYGRALEAALRHAGARAVLERTVAAYEAGEEVDIRSVLEAMDGFAGACGESPYTMRMLPYLCLLEPARARYEAAGLDGAVYHDSFADLLWKTRECRKIYGVWGSFVAPWFYRFFALRCFALGRLQFEWAVFQGDAPLARGTPVLNVHVPSSGPLCMEECEASYARAVRFFGLSGREAVPFVCDSWLLHPLCAGLPEASGIRRFAAAYRLLYVTEDPARMDMWIIFGRPWDGNAAALPEGTALQRLFKAQLLSGGSVGRGYGLYLRQERPVETPPGAPALIG